MADDFGFFSSSESGAAEAAEEDPAAAFLAQQENEIAGIENDEGISCAEGTARGSQEAAGETMGECAGVKGGGRRAAPPPRGPARGLPRHGAAGPKGATACRGNGIFPEEAAAISHLAGCLASACHRKPAKTEESCVERPHPSHQVQW